MNINVQEFKKELKELLEKYNVSLSGEYEGDTHGISSETFVVTDSDANEHTLNHCSSYINASDL